ncbi:hypothetical protein N7495_006314 [Penicillium taxi]|uniref:uncharacterized protein n=1 Tax=Penicillium taxi TaxID=168475 RepID=UPI0025456383|nr:uncharacterized protein N7495_006314 [Penicillium taxi]KAJ5894623.1 hypothetical protein N7495_006314 [Penicillium taxi]
MAGLVSAANLGGVADPRLGNEADIIGTSKEHSDAPPIYDVHSGIPPPVIQGSKSIYLDSSITFENYRYWAIRSREVEKHIRTDNKGLSVWKNKLLRRKITDGNDAPTAPSTPPGQSEKTNADVSSDPPNSQACDNYGVSEQEWETAQRAARTATWGSVFYLITTDILGPNNVPYAISRMGYGPGFALYTVLGGFALYSGMQLWNIFVGLDSTRFPMRNYGDMAFRIFGKWAQFLVNILQSFQFFLNVTLLIVSNGQGLAQMVAGVNNTGGFLCFIAAEVIFMVIGFVLGQIRTLQNLGWLANLAIWLNIIVIITTMAVVYEFPPNYSAVETSFGITKGPIVTSAGWPSGYKLEDNVNAMMNAVFAYGGATLFTELMAEMRRPYDFWKAMICAEIFIYVCYLVNGMVVYHAQGQFVYNPAYEGIPNTSAAAYRYQTLGNALSFITGVIAALLYGNIGIKVFYSAVCHDIFHFPPLEKRIGKWIWVVLVPIYWILAWIVAGAIPQISNLSSFVGAACILQFSYTFPPILLVGYHVQRDAILPEEEFDPVTGVAQRVDSGFKRWVRGYKKRFLWNTFDVFYCLAALSLAGLGIWASVISMNTSFNSGRLTSFTCANPAS